MHPRRTSNVLRKLEYFHRPSAQLTFCGFRNVSPFELITRTVRLFLRPEVARRLRPLSLRVRFRSVMEIAAARLTRAQHREHSERPATLPVRRVATRPAEDNSHPTHPDRGW